MQYSVCLYRATIVANHQVFLALLPIVLLRKYNRVPLQTTHKSLYPRHPVRAQEYPMPYRVWRHGRQDLVLTMNGFVAPHYLSILPHGMQDILPFVAENRPA